MTTANLALYRILVKAGATEADAESAATFDASVLATKGDIADLKTAIAAMEAALAWKIGGLLVGSLVSLTGIFALIVRWLTKVG